MSTHPHPDADRDELSPVDAALGEAIARAGQDLQDVPPDLANGHLAAITSLASEHAHQAPAPALAPAPSWGSRLRRVAGLTAFKVAVGAGVAVAGTTGGLAATGHLPAPVQQVVSDGAGWFGLDLPAPTTEAVDPSDTEDEPPAPAEESDTVPPDVDTYESDPQSPFVPGSPADGDDPDEVAPREEPPVDPDADSDPDDPDSRPVRDPDPEPGEDEPEPPATNPDPAPPAGDDPDDGAAPEQSRADSKESAEQADDPSDSSADAGQHQVTGEAGATDDVDRPAGR